MLTIEEFYSKYTIDNNFDENFYCILFPEVIDFYQPYCIENNIDDKHRLYYHYCVYKQSQSSMFQKVYCDLIRHNSNLYEIPSEWQQPNATELFYFKNHQITPVKTDSVYIAYSWANHLDRNTKIDQLLIERIANIPGKKTTICQHIRWEKLIPLWDKMKINTVYTSHCTKDSVNNTINNLTIRSWPLYASSIFNKSTISNIDIKKRQYLASFIGCHRKDYRSKIRIELNNYFHKQCNQDIFFELYDDWFYETNIYHSQSISNQQKLNIERYNNIIADSIFSLCPEGTGPNTIRVWESMALGSIPVIYSDHWEPPYVKDMSWNDFSIFIPQKDYHHTIEILSSINEEKIKEMRSNCIKAFYQFQTMTC